MSVSFTKLVQDIRRISKGDTFCLKTLNIAKSLSILSSDDKLIIESFIDNQDVSNQDRKNLSIIADKIERYFLKGIDDSKCEHSFHKAYEVYECDKCGATEKRWI